MNTENTNSRKEGDSLTVHTEGGAYVQGNVNTNGGDVAGRDLIRTNVLNLENSIIENLTIKYDDGESKLLRSQLKTEKERRWHEQFELLRTELGGGYHEPVRHASDKILDEVDTFESEGHSVNAGLKAKLYRLAAIAYLPRHSGGDEKHCRKFVQLAEQFSQGDGLLHCRITGAILLHDIGQSQQALQQLQEINLPEAQRLRFALLIDTQQHAECQQLVETGQVNLQSGNNDPEWTRAALGYYVLFNQKENTLSTAERLLEFSPSASNYRVAAFSLLRLAHHRVTEFYEKHDILPGFSLGLELDEWIDVEVEFKAIGYYVQAAKRYEEHHCPDDAVQMWIVAIQQGRENPKVNQPEQERWLQSLGRIAPNHPLRQMITIVETKEDISLLDVVLLTSNLNADSIFMLRAVLAAATTPFRAAELATTLERDVARYSGNPAGFTYYVYVIITLWHISGDPRRAHKWIEQRSSQLPSPRYVLLFHAWLCIVNAQYDQAKDWLEKALSLAPNHPEVLVMAHWFAQRQSDFTLQQEYAKALFEFVSTAQTAVWYIVALRLNGNTEQILALLEECKGLPLDERLVRQQRADAYLHLRRMKHALPDLEWLRAHNETTNLNLLHLAAIYQHLHDFDRAASVLRQSVELYPENIDAYFALSQMYLLMGRRQESYDWAKRTLERFPDSSDAAFNLFTISHSTGHEVKPEVGEALRSLLPGGKFAEQSPMIAVTIDEVKEMMLSRRDVQVNMEESYAQSKISRMMLCQWRNQTLFEDHWLCSEYGVPRYISQGSQRQELADLLNEKPGRVVLDYSALLTLWSLFGEQIVEILASYFDRVLIPETLREILNEELISLSQLQQPDRQVARKMVRDALTRSAAKIVTHPHDEVTIERDITGGDSEDLIAERGSFVYLNEHRPPDYNSSVPTIGIQAVASALLQRGEIDHHQFSQLSLTTKVASLNEITALNQILQNERQIVINLQTMVSWALFDPISLNTLFDLFDRLHVAERSKQFLERESVSFRVRAQLPDQLNRLWGKLAEAENRQFISFASIPNSARKLSQHVAERETRSSDEANDSNWQWQRLWRYYDELIGLAELNHLPVWTDDRFTKLLALDDWRPQFAFSTDTFLEYTQFQPVPTQGIDSNRYHALYRGLAKAGYRYLPINVEHILWRLRQSQMPQNHDFEVLLSSYRNSVIDFWQRARANVTQYEQGGSLLGDYCDQLFALLYRLQQEGTSISIAAAIFAQLDLARHAGQLTWGSEPMFYTMLLLRPINLSITQHSEEVDTRIDEDSLNDISDWLHRLILTSGVALEMLQESWYQLLSLGLLHYNRGEDDLVRLSGKLYVLRMMVAIPDPILHYLLTTDMGEQLRREFVSDIREMLTIQIPSERLGTQMVKVPLAQWQQDLQRAVDSYIVHPTDTPITHGIVTIKTQHLPGSIFLSVEALPTGIYQKDQAVYGVAQIYCLLGGFTHSVRTHRNALWQIGLHALESHALPTTAWQQLHDGLLVEQHDCPIGEQARTLLLSEWPIIKSYIEQACLLATDSVGHLLDAITPTIVRGWLKQTTVDWSTGDGLTLWATQQASTFVEYSTVDALLEVINRYGHSLFPDAPIFRGKVLEQTVNMPLEQQEELVDKVLAQGNTNTSPIFKANSVLFFFAWLNHRRKQCGTSPNNDLLAPHQRETLSELLAIVFRGNDARPGADLTVSGANLVVLLCRWFNYFWRQKQNSSQVSDIELAYLSTVAASLFVDALPIHRPEAHKIIDELTQRLQHEVALLPYDDKALQAAERFYHPCLSGFVNYSAAFLLCGLLSVEIAVEDFPFSDSLKSATLQCGIVHRSRQALIATQELSKSFVDHELVQDIPGALLTLLSKTEPEEEVWHDNDLPSLKFLIMPELALMQVNNTLEAMQTLANEEEILQRIIWLFQGEVLPTKTWCDVVQRLLDEDTLGSIRAYPTCYRILVDRLGLLLSREDIGLPPELAQAIRSFLLEVPKTEKMAELIRVKAEAMAILLATYECGDLVRQWLEILADLTKDNIPVFRTALLPFIRNWTVYTQASRNTLCTTFTKLDEKPEFAVLWEFARIRGNCREEMAKAKL